MDIAGDLETGLVRLEERRRRISMWEDFNTDEILAYWRNLLEEGMKNVQGILGASNI